MQLRPVYGAGRPLLYGAMLGGTGYLAGRRRAAMRRDALRRAQAGQPEPPSGGGDDLVAKLTELGRLHEQGVLSPEEFTAAKRKLLGG